MLTNILEGKKRLIVGIQNPIFRLLEQLFSALMTRKDVLLEIFSGAFKYCQHELFLSVTDDLFRERLENSSVRRFDESQCHVHKSRLPSYGYRNCRRFVSIQALCWRLRSAKGKPLEKKRKDESRWRRQGRAMTIQEGVDARRLT